MSAAQRAGDEILRSARDDGGGVDTSLIYLYGIAAAGSATDMLLEEGGVPGMEPGTPLFPVRAAGLVAAVSRVPAALFDEAPLNALVADLPRLTDYAVRHETAVRLLLRSAFIPMAFGAVYRGAEGVAALLKGRTQELTGLLTHLDGREEWGLKVIAELPALFAAAERESETVARLAAEAASARPGHAYLLGRKREQVLAHEASRLAASMLAEIVERLGALAAATIEDDPGPPLADAREQLALKAAFLVDTAAATRFQSVATELAAGHAGRGLRVELSGPWAPYSFVRGAGGRDG